MVKKMFLRAKVSKGDKWKIDYTIFTPHKEVRKRNFFNLNEIEDLKVREKVAEAICDFLEDFDFSKLVTEVEEDPIKEPTIGDLIFKIPQIQVGTYRKNTTKTYTTAVNKFVNWAKPKGFLDLALSKFGIKEAKSYMDFLLSSKIAPKSVNNNLTQIRTIFTEMAEGDKTKLNPFSLQKKVRVIGKNVRGFTETERKIIAKYIEQNDYWLFRGLLLQYYCYVRPKEISALRFRDFDFKLGVVKINVYEAKCWKERYVTIPKSIMHYFVDGRFDKQPANFFLFGRVGDGSRRELDKMAPSAIKARDDRAYKKHRRYLEVLQSDGLLNDIKGLTWYSWKYTGISEHVKQTSPLGTRDQAGHSKFDTTMIYYEQKKVNPEYQDLPNTLFL